MLDVIDMHGQSVILVVLSVFDPAEVGSEGKGYRWKTSSLDDTEEDELAECIWGEMSSDINIVLIYSPSFQTGSTFFFTKGFKELLYWSGL